MLQQWMGIEMHCLLMVWQMLRLSGEWRFVLFMTQILVFFSWTHRFCKKKTHPIIICGSYWHNFWKKCVIYLLNHLTEILVCRISYIVAAQITYVHNKQLSRKLFTFSSTKILTLPKNTKTVHTKMYLFHN